jgi:putative tricarboxylic transport membrane protein
VPTAREQGIDLVWPIIRGVWMGPKVPEADYQRWVQRFEQLERTPEFAQMRLAHGLYPFSMTGAALTEYVKHAVDDYKQQARQFKLVR